MTMKVGDTPNNNQSPHESDSTEHSKLSQKPQKKQVKRKKKEFEKKLKKPVKPAIHLEHSLPIDIPRAIEFTSFVEQKNTQENPSTPVLFHSSFSDKTPQTLRQSIIQDQAIQLAKPGSQYRSSNVEISHALAGSLHWRLVNGPLRGLKISATITEGTLYISLNPADSEQRDVLNTCRSHLEQIATRKRRGKPVKIEVKHG